MEKQKYQHITGLGKDPENKLMVQKARPLFSLWQSDLNLAEFKILDLYLARINTKDPEHRTVILKKGEIEKILGVTRILKEDLNQRLKNLHNSVRFDRPEDECLEEENKLRNISLFEETAAYRSKDGEWEVELTCSQAAMKYIFNVEQLGYFRYKLRSVAKLTSRYTYILFQYLESNRYRIAWEIPLEELKRILKCENEVSYQEFKVFNQQILQRCQKEIFEKTECRFKYEMIKAGRKVTAIRFTLEPLAKILPKEDLADMPELPEDTPMQKEVLFLSGACNNEFTNKEMQAILFVLNNKALPGDMILKYDDYELVKYHYLNEQYTLFCVEAEKREIRNRFKYFLAMLKNDDTENDMEGAVYTESKVNSASDRDEQYNDQDVFADVEKW